MPSKHSKSDKAAKKKKTQSAAAAVDAHDRSSGRCASVLSESSASHHDGEDERFPNDVDSAVSAPAVLSRHQREQAQLAELFKRYAVRNWIFLFLLGLINNFHYNLVIAGANTLASSYGMKSLVALISFTNVFFGIIARILNAFVSNRVAYNIRMTLMSSGTLIGLFFVSLSGPFGRGNNVSSFVVLLVGVAFTGTSYCYGESVALTFVQRYPPKTVGAWGSGTGISGVIASLLFLFLTNAGLSEQTIFLISMPLAVCYWLVFNFGIAAPHKVVMVTEPSTTPGEEGTMVTRRVILHSGHEEKIAHELHERVRLNGGTISDPEYKMIMNFRGLSWHSIPPPPSEKVAVADDAEEEHYAVYRRQSGLPGDDAAPAFDYDDDDDAPVMRGTASHGGGHRSDAFHSRQSRDVDPAIKKPALGAGAVGEGMVESCQSPTSAHPGANEGEAVPASDAGPQHPKISFRALAAKTTDGAETGGEPRHGDDLHYPCCRALCGCYARDCGLRRWWRLHGKVIGTMHNAMVWYMFNLAVVYITEYAAQFMAPFSFYCREEWEGNFWIKNSYTVTQFCYQFGVFISRSSLTFGLHIPFVGVLSIIQLCNAVLWFVQAKVMFIASRTSESKEVGLAFLLFVWMLFVGLVGGASYVNVFYLILCKGRKMQAADEKVKSVVLLRALRGDKCDNRAGDDDDDDNDDGRASHTAAAVATGPSQTPAVRVSPVAVTTTTTVAPVAPSHPQAQREEMDSAFGVYSPAEGHDDAAGLDASDVYVSLTTAPPVKKPADGKAATVDGQPLGSGPSSSSSDEDDDGVTNNNNADTAGRRHGTHHGGNQDAAAFALGDDDDRDPHHAALLAASEAGAKATHKSVPSSSNPADGPSSSNSAEQAPTSHASQDPRDSHSSTARSSRFWRWCPFSRGGRGGDKGADGGDDAESLTDFKPLSPHEESELEELSIALGEEWQSRRELAMAIGSLYAMVGICIGTILDVIFTNTVLKNTVTCS